MEKILQSYLRRLTNLSGNNRSLLLLRLISDQFIDLHELDFALNAPSFDIIKGLIGKKKKIQLCSEADARDSDTNQFSRKLKKLQRIEKFIFQERGSKDLYIGWPFIRGKLAEDTLIRCPLIFFPVTLELTEGKWLLVPRKGVNITLNKTFLLAYAYYNKTLLDEELIELTLNDYDEDSTVFRTQLYELLKNSQLELNFNQENFMDQLQPFTQFKKAELEKKEKTGRLKLYPEAVLGIFPQAGSYLVPDYVRLLENNDVEDISEFFTSRKKEDPEKEGTVKPSDLVKEETTFTPFQIDAYQEHALNLVKKGNSLVVQGPPGTGKSQLICNLISDYIARGKNVLLVCQKKAALDVVYSRLKSKELHDFIGLVHDFKNDRRSIFDQIARQIDSLDEYKQKNNGLDAIHLERTFLQASKKIDMITEELEEFKNALFDESECGKSPKELYLISSPDKPSIHLNQLYRQFPFTRVPDFTATVSRYLDYYHRFEKKPHFWIDGPSYAGFSTGDFVRIKEILKEIPLFQIQLKKESKTFAHQEIDFETARHFLSHREDLAQLASNLDNETVFQYYAYMKEQSQEEDLQWLSGQEKNMMQCFKEPGLETSLKSKDLGRFQEALERAIKARKGVFSWIRWRLFSADKIFINRVLVANNLKSNRQGFEVLLERIDNRLNFEHIVTRIHETPWLTEFPETFRKMDIQNWFFFQKIAVKSIQLSQVVRALSDYVPVKGQKREDYVAKLQSLLDFIDKIPVQLHLWSGYISEGQVRKLLLDKEDLQQVTRQLNEDFDALVEYHSIKDSFSTEEFKLIEELIEMEKAQKGKVIDIFINSLSLAWIDHIEQKYPILRAVSSLKLDHLTKDLQQFVDEKMRVSQDILLLKSREKTYENLEYNRLNNLVTYRDLYHQVTKKKQIWPIRRVISNFREELFSLLPCWMASPESASAIFPMEEIFDLVIFDEASQCFAERGIPAMYRGKTVVIAGDDKQLQPNDLYRVRWEDENTDDTPELEVDSLLRLAKQYLMEVNLRGHYRSRSLELIEFSNQYFYDGKLKLLPDFNVVKKKQPAIHYLKTDGVWEDNANRAEAEKVIGLVHRLSKEQPDKEIGVVTFNARQQVLILDLLDEYQLNHNLPLSDSFFVKNIENVQGDEKDVIIFSTAYAPDRQGNIRLQFGSLNMEGGENRLNVAITRAREAVYVVSSLQPSQLKTEDTKNQGPKLLKAYLEYAWNVSKSRWLPATPNGKDHSQSWYLKHRIKDSTFSDFLKEELPFADLTLKREDDYLGLILTDDESFFDTLSSKEAHCYRYNHLREKNWPFIAFYSREYWINREQSLDKLQKFIYRSLG